MLLTFAVMLARGVVAPMAPLKTVVSAPVSLTVRLKAPPTVPPYVTVAPPRLVRVRSPARLMAGL